MFGYVRPVRGALREPDQKLYRAAYCGLCRTLRRRYGILAPAFLNFDFALLALLMIPEDTLSYPERGRCSIHPLRTEMMCQPSPELDLAADESLILAYWKLRDGVKDDGILGGMPQRMISWLIYPRYRTAAAYRPEFDRAVRDSLEELSGLEQAMCPSIDRTSDTFSRLLQAAVPKTGESVQDRSMELLLYHLGRWIYLIDAQDDLELDQRKGHYNPIALRYGQAGDRAALSNTLEQSLNLARSALGMLQLGCRTPVIENVFYLGLPMVQQAVLDGTWAKKRKGWEIFS